MNLKRIIREELNKQLLTEGCVASILWQGKVECTCGCDGHLYVVQWSNCSIHNTLDCDGCPEPCNDGGQWTGGGRMEPTGPTMGESRGYRSHRTRR